jgi:hypothetical protein
MAKPLLLTYNLKPVTAAGLDRVCRKLGIRVREVAREEYARPIGALAGIPVAGQVSPAPTAAFGDEMLVICHMMSDELDALLQAMREEGLPCIPLKAVLTPVNVLWNSFDLRNELAREHSAVQRRSKQPR